MEKFIIFDPKNVKNSSGFFTAGIDGLLVNQETKFVKWLVEPGQAYRMYTDLAEIEDEEYGCFTLTANSAGLIKETYCRPGDVLADVVILAKYRPKFDFFRVAGSFFDDYLVTPFFELLAKISRTTSALLFIALPFFFIAPMVYYYGYSYENQKLPAQVGVPTVKEILPTSPSVAEGKPIVVSITKSGELYLSETKVSVLQLEKRIKALISESLADRVFLRADKRLDFIKVQQTITLLKKAGVKKIALVQEQSRVSSSKSSSPPPPPKKTNQENLKRSRDQINVDEIENLKRKRVQTDLDKIRSALKSCWSIPAIIRPGISEKLPAIFADLDFNAEGTLSNYALRSSTFDDDDPLAKQQSVFVASVHRAVNRCREKFDHPSLALNKVAVEFNLSEGIFQSVTSSPNVFTCSVNLKSLLFADEQCKATWSKSAGLSISGASSCQDNLKKASLMVQQLATGGKLSGRPTEPSGISVVLALPQFTLSEEQTFLLPEFSDGEYRGNHNGTAVTIDFKNQSEFTMSDDDGVIKFAMDCQ
ncbi:biopolymer transporter ExbD [Alphaproteobacteria bacterium]|nr:biopolymer transporter ExbD [Alphaproteobacteria bacterium]